MNSTLIKHLKKEFADRYGNLAGQKRDTSPAVFFSPSRVNLIGEHIDYNGGTVFPCAISIGTYAAARPNDSRQIRLYSLNLEKGGSLDAGALPDFSPANDWLNYAVGVFRALQAKGYTIGGADIVIAGDIPNGAGLSSSASLEMLLACIQNHFYNDRKIPVMDQIQAGISCENDFIGLRSGVMDQSVIALGRRGQAVLLNTGTMEYEYVPLDLGDNRLLVMNTNARRELTASAYNQRRSECESALSRLQSCHPELHLTALCDLEEDDLPALDCLLGDPVLYKRARHAVTEQRRVEAAVFALQASDLAAFGAILREGNRSMREDYESTGPELDAITAAANDFPGCLGARMTGGGFGGCAIALVKQDAVEAFIPAVKAAYKAKTGLAADFYQVEVADGTRLLEEA